MECLFRSPGNKRGEDKSWGSSFPQSGPVLAEGGAQLTQATGHRPQAMGVWMCCRWGKGGCPGRRGSMPGHLSALQDTHFGPLPSSREQTSVFCFGINWAGCGKIGGRLPKLSGACSFHRLGRRGCRAPTSPCCCPSPTAPISFPWSLPDHPPTAGSAWGVLYTEGTLKAVASQAGL